MTSFLRRVSAAAATLAVAATLLAVGLVAPTHAAEGEDGIAGGPVTASGAGATRSRFSYQLDPGQLINDEYQVHNIGSTPQSITVYATDAYTDDAGSYSLLDTGAQPQDVGTWVSFEGGATSVTLELPPGGEAIVPFTLAVPADARPGDHAGGIVMSAVTVSDKVTLDRRVATRLYARIKGELQAGLTISSITASHEPSLNPFDGRTTVTYTVTNTGNVALGANAVGRVRGLFGIPLGAAATSEIPEMLPGDTRSIAAVVSGVGQWVYLNPSVDLAATIDEEALNPGPLPTASRDAVLFVVPWSILALLLIAGLVWLLVRFNRRRNDRRAREWLEYSEAEAARKAQEQLDQAKADAGV